tara:strand:+ start:213 stop:587 length:375 start_codon:yes stop_codon:yes gene_type:complete
VRKAKLWKLDGKLPRPRCPRCRGDVLVIVDGKNWQAECDACGTWSKEQMGDYRLVVLPTGEEYWSISNILVHDETPTLILSLLPFWTIDEVVPAPKSEDWERRVRAVREEAEMRAKNKKRTVNG